MSKANKFAGICIECGCSVPKGKGFIKKQNGKWVTYHAADKCEVREARESKLPLIRKDQYQSAVYDAVASGHDGPHILVKARAGSGKTTVQCEGIHGYTSDHNGSVAAYAFGTADGKRLKDNLFGTGAEAGTTHSAGMAAIRSKWGRKRINKFKDADIMIKVIGEKEKHEVMWTQVSDLVSKAKADGLCPDDVDLIRLLDEDYDLGIPSDLLDEAVKMTVECLELAMDVETYRYNFDDMLWLVVVYNLPLPSFDFVFVDECQDWNNCQLWLLEQFNDAGTRIMAVGDPEQSLYAFRGARHDAFDRINAILTGSDRGCLELPMPVSYRNSLAVIEEAQKIVSDIQARPGAPKGSVVKEACLFDLVETAGEDCMLICRTNAPLVQIARFYATIGRKFYMRGGDKEAMLLKWYVDMWATGNGERATTDVGEMINRAQVWINDRAVNTTGYKLAEHKERLEVIELLSESCFSVAEVKSKIDEVFMPPKSSNGCVILSTIHRAKGSEADTVIHIHPELCPHPKATSEEQKKQESNAHYVAITRAITNYIETVGNVAELRSKSELAA